MSPQSSTLALQTHKAETKQCTKCLAYLSPSEFYSKGNRLDSECKKCRRLRRRTTYVSQNARSSLARVRSVIDRSVSWEIERLRALREETQRIIRCAAHDDGDPEEKEIIYATRN